MMNFSHFCRQRLDISADNIISHYLFREIISPELILAQDKPDEYKLLMDKVLFAIHSPYELPFDDEKVRWFTPNFTEGFVLHTVEYRRTSIIFLDGRDGISCFNYDHRYRSR